MIKVVNDPRVDKEIRSLSQKDQSKIIEITELFIKYGFYVKEPYLKKLVAGLWELRTGRWRLLFGVLEGEAVIVNIFLKKTQKTPKQEIKTALRRLKEY